MKLIHAQPEIFPEIEAELDDAGISHERGALLANNAEGFSAELIMLGAGALSTLVVQAITTWMKKKQGQRKVSVQTVDKDNKTHSVTVETPDTDEVVKLLEMSLNQIIYLKDEEKEE
ncbi:hypothetical protein [Pontiella agarivorans]|uniref:Uncharacterized protein n=1 Tax=Pontiella agarivorans TaxID=3038953 RepID=A0ABU5MXB9_9BACT|nr:hypothetical protein [Pontiella agarivorans]MDZ8118822.1 hypothetical protein [Pontiella agarivorans]